MHSRKTSGLCDVPVSRSCMLYREVPGRAEKVRLRYNGVDGAHGVVWDRGVAEVSSKVQQASPRWDGPHTPGWRDVFPRLACWPFHHRYRVNQMSAKKKLERHATKNQTRVFMRFLTSPVLVLATLERPESVCWFDISAVKNLNATVMSNSSTRAPSRLASVTKTACHKVKWRSNSCL